MRIPLERVYFLPSNTHNITHKPSSLHFFAVSDQTSDQLEIYQFPIDAWCKELQLFLAKVSAAEANGSQVSVDSDQEVGRVLTE